MLTVTCNLSGDKTDKIICKKYIIRRKILRQKTNFLIIRLTLLVKILKFIYKKKPPKIKVFQKKTQRGL